MQTPSHCLIPKNVKLLLTFMLCIIISLASTVDTFSNNVCKIPDKDIQLTFNGKAIDQKRGITQSDFNKTEENKLMIKVKPKTFDSEQNVNLHVILAKGTRPLNAKDLISFSGQVEIDLSGLLSNAKSGDRIVLSFNDDERIILIPIS